MIYIQLCQFILWTGFDEYAGSYVMVKVACTHTGGKIHVHRV